jgi:hypothetical protein
MSTPQQNIAHVAKWLRRLSGQFGAETGGVALYHAPAKARAGAKPEKVQDFAIRPDAELDLVAAEIAQRAHDEASMLGNGQHHFTLYAFRDQKEHFDSTRLMVFVDSAPEGEVPETTANDLLGQAYRHLEFERKEIARERSGIINTMAMLLDMQDQRLRMYEQGEVERLKIGLETVKLREDVHAEREDKAMVRSLTKLAGEVAINRLGPYVPRLAAKLLGPAEEEQPAEEARPAAPSFLPLESSAPVHVGEAQVIAIESRRAITESNTPTPERAAPEAAVTVDVAPSSESPPKVTKKRRGKK